ncbi:MAG: murein L,D-transpeptidase family protein [Hyphomicrobiaceae bacterium]
MSKHLSRVGLAVAAAWLVAGCSQVVETPPAMKPLSQEAMHLLGAKGMTTAAPIFIRIFKEESELEVWKARDDGHYYHFKTYPICNWSGDLGPKEFEGDKQAPEGFYKVTSAQMNPNSKYYLSFNIGFPNAYDKALGRTGNSLMVHGDCRSAGCYAMTDALIEEIYGLAREALTGGQEYFYVHAYPFHMTEANMKRHKDDKWIRFWKRLKEGYDYFETARQPPEIAVCNRNYLVNVRFTNQLAHVDADGPCPAFVRPPPQIFVDNAQPGTLAAAHVVATGPKLRNLAVEQSEWAAANPPPYGLTKTPKQSMSVWGFGVPDGLVDPPRRGSSPRD